MRATWVQRNISPIATRAFARVGFTNRNHVAAGIRKVAAQLDEADQVRLWNALISPFFLYTTIDALNKPLEFGIVQGNALDVDPKNVEGFHLNKTLTKKRLTLAAERFFLDSGREDLMVALPAIFQGEIEAEAGQPGMPSLVNFQRLLSSRIPHILQNLLASEVFNPAWHARILERAFMFAATLNHSSRNELLYHLEKVARIGGDIHSIIASLFMRIPSGQLQASFAGIKSHPEFGPLSVYRDSICDIVGRFQRLYDGFHFDPAQLTSDENYIEKKMSELVRKAGTAQSLLLFFLEKLDKARQAVQADAPIFDEIRFVYAPLAERLGLIFLADDLRDQFMRVSCPAKYQEILDVVKRRFTLGYEAAKIFLGTYVRGVTRELVRHGINPSGLTIKFRVKSPFSIFNKVEVRQEYTYESIKDVFGIKIICSSNSVDDLKKIAKIISAMDFFRQTPGGIKVSLSQVSDDGQWRGIKLEGKSVGTSPLVPVEIQIMTEEMNHANNHGKAASWVYNLAKELEGVKQVFTRQEPHEVVTGDYFKNFTQLLNFWTLPGAAS